MFAFFLPHVIAIPKANSVFSFCVHNYEFSLYGNHMKFRSSERSARKFKDKPTIDLWPLDTKSSFLPPIQVHNVFLLMKINYQEEMGNTTQYKNYITIAMKLKLKGNHTLNLIKAATSLHKVRCIDYWIF